MRILALTTSFPAYKDDMGGFFVYKLVGKIAELGNEITVVTPMADEAKKTEKWDSIKVKRFEYMYPRGYRRLTGGYGGIPENTKKSVLATLQIPIMMALFTLNALIECIGKDVLHAHWIPSAAAALPCRFFLGKKIVLTVRDPELVKTRNIFLRAVIKFILRSVHCVCLISSSLLEEVKLYGIDEQKIRVIPNGVDIHEFRPRDKKKMREKHNLKKDAFITIFAGNLIKRKGITYLLDAFRKKIKKNKNNMLLVVGEGEEKTVIEKYITKNRLQEHVKIIGFIDKKEITEWISLSDTVVSPSLAETGPNIVLEAMSSGIPVIATNVGICSDVIQDGTNGFLVPTKNSEAIYKRMMQLQDRELRLKMGENARETITKSFGWDVCARSYLRTYMETIT